MKTRPWLIAPVPRNDIVASTLGSCCSTAITCCWCRTRSSNDVPSTVSVVPKIWELSSLGRKPFGTTTNRTPVPSRMAAEKAIAARRRFITQSRLRSYQPSTCWYRRSDCSYSFPWCASRDGRRNRLHSIGVRVSDTSPDTRMAAPMVTANSWNNRPTIPPMKSTGMKTAASDSVIDRIVNPTSRAPSNAAASGGSPFSMWRTMFSSITRASSTTNPTDRAGRPDGVGARLSLDGEHDGPTAVVPGRALVVLHVVQHLADVLETHGRAVAVGYDEGSERGRVLELPVRLHRVGAVRAPQHARRQVDVAGVDRARHLVDPQRAAGQGLGIELDAHGVLGGAVHVDLRHAADRGQALRDERLGVLVQSGQRQRPRAQRVVDDRLVGWIHLLVGRRQQAARELAQSLGDRRLHVLRGGVDIAVQGELQRDARAAEARRRGHLVHAGDGRELFLERRRHGGRQRLL